MTLIHDRRPQVLGLDLQHFRQRLGFGFQPLRAALGFGERLRGSRRAPGGRRNAPLRRRWRRFRLRRRRLLDVLDGDGQARRDQGRRSPARCRSSRAISAISASSLAARSLCWRIAHWRADCAAPSRSASCAGQFGENLLGSGEHARRLPRRGASTPLRRAGAFGASGADAFLLPP